MTPRLPLERARPTASRACLGVTMGESGRSAGTIVGLADIGMNRPQRHASRSEEHTSELQSRSDLVCRLLLEKKKKTGQNQMQTEQQIRAKEYESLHHMHSSRRGDIE